MESSNANRPPVQAPVTDAAIAQSFIQPVEGESPLDFINKNLRRKVVAPPPQNNPTPPLPETPVTEIKKADAPLTPDVPAREEPKVLPTPEEQISLFVEDEPSEVETEEPTPTAVPKSDEPDFESETEIEPAANNFKKLRTKFKETAKLAKEREEALKVTNTRLEKILKGEEDIPVVVELKNKVAELEPFQHLHALKDSKAYKSRIIEPKNKVKEKLATLAKGYDVPPEMLLQAAEITDVKEQNYFLMQHFDELGALEAKQHISELQKINTDAKSFEAEPVKALATLEVEEAHFLEEKNLTRKNTITETGKSSWNKAISKIRKEGKIKELIPRDSDPEFNSKWVEPIQRTAEANFNRIVQDLTDGGMEVLSPQVAEALARATLLSITAATAIQRANAAEAELAAMQETATRRNGYSRPNFGGAGRGTAGGGAPAAKPGSTLEDVALQQVNTVLQGR